MPSVAGRVMFLLAIFTNRAHSLAAASYGSVPVSKQKKVMPRAQTSIALVMRGLPEDDDGELKLEVAEMSPPSGDKGDPLLPPAEERSGMEAERGNHEGSCTRERELEDVVVESLYSLYSQTTSGAMNMGVPARMVSAESSSRMGSIFS